MQVVVPNGGEVWEVGTTHETPCTDSIEEEVRIELCRDAVFESAVVVETESDGPCA